MSTLTLVDGSNVLNEIGRLFAGGSDLSSLSTSHGAYLRDWLDLDRFVDACLRPADEHLVREAKTGLGTVIFRSRKKIGSDRSKWLLKGDEELTAFWGRQGGAPNTSVSLVEIPGSGPGEKGVDTSIIVYLFETVDHWSTAVLFTNDTDFVPAVWSLRRKGKRILCVASEIERSSPLVQSCQHFIEWREPFLHADFAMFELLQPKGILDRFLTSGEIKEARVSRGDTALFVNFAGDPGSDFAKLQVERLNNMLAPTALTANVNSHDSLQIRPRDGALSVTMPVMDGYKRHRDVHSNAEWHRFIIGN